MLKEHHKGRPPKVLLLGCSRLRQVTGVEVNGVWRPCPGARRTFCDLFTRELTMQKGTGPWILETIAHH